MQQTKTRKKKSLNNGPSEKQKQLTGEEWSSPSSQQNKGLKAKALQHASTPQATPHTKRASPGPHPKGPPKKEPSAGRRPDSTRWPEGKALTAPWPRPLQVPFSLDCIRDSITIAEKKNPHGADRILREVDNCLGLILEDSVVSLLPYKVNRGRDRMSGEKVVEIFPLTEICRSPLKEKVPMHSGTTNIAFP
ncbi:hypothetical protein OIU77_005035 [Salix suchowensis]|uniref:Uncharacterized protein n=1 Tax=Salix suchowensis TaxID=1278906 RepID=A0ABQ8ZGQ1_9ROSI|nr:hypothetical protein OIU77_005035 [Salix suchowensis]